MTGNMSVRKKLTTSQRIRKLGHEIVENRWLYVLALPALVYIIGQTPRQYRQPEDEWIAELN